MTTATRENPNLPGPCPGAERMVWPVKTHPAQSTGLESKKNSGDGEHFSLDFSFYRTGLPAKVPYLLAAPVLKGQILRQATLDPLRNKGKGTMCGEAITPTDLAGTPHHFRGGWRADLAFAKGQRCAAWL